MQWSSVFSIFFFSLGALAANEGSQTYTLDGVLYQKGTATPLLDSSILLKIQIINPAGTCLLYEETQTVSTSSSKGYFNIQVGSSLGSTKRTVNDPGRTMAQIFQNMTAIGANSIPGQTCAGSSYVPTAGDVRYFRITVTPSTTMIADALSPDIIMDSVPQALVAQSIQGLERASILTANTASGVSLNQISLESLFTGSAWTNLQSILSGNFLRTDSSGATLPAYAATPSGVSIGDMWYDSTTNEIKYQSNAGVQTVGSSGTVSGNSITSGTISGTTSILTSGNLVTSGTISGATVNGGTLNAGTVTAGTMSASTLVATTVSSATVQGTTISGSTVQASQLRIFNGSQYVQLTAQPMSSSYALALPTADGVSGQVMSTNGSGVLSWINASSGIAGTISIGQGGTAATSFSSSRIIASNSTGTAMVSFGCSLNEVISFDVSGMAQCSSVSSIAGSGLIANGGNSTGAAVSLGTNDNYALQLKTNNSVAMTISNNGYVGIGISNPTSNMEVNSSIKVSNSSGGSLLIAPTFGSAQAVFKTTSGYNNETMIGSITNNDVVFYQNNSARLRFDTVGTIRVLKDTSFGSGNAPTSAIDVSGAVTAWGMSSAPSVASSNSGRIYFDYSTGKFKVSQNGGAYVDLISASSISGFLNGGNAFGGTSSLGNTDNHALNFITNNTTAMTISQSGNVGIGTTSPAAQLHVVGAAGTASSTVGKGFVVVAGAGYAGGNGNGGAISLTAGGGAGTGVGGNVTMQAGAGVGNPHFSARGNVTIAGGDDGSSTGGNVTIRGGTYSSAGGGSILLSGSGSSTTGGVTINSGATSGVVGGSGGISIYSPSAAGGTNSAGGGFTLTMGNGDGTGAGGAITMTAGNGGATNVNGANVTINPGAKGGSGSHGNIILANSRGNVGIGTTTPSTALDISGAFTARGMSAAAVPSVSDANTGRIYYDYSANKFKVSQNGGAYADLVSAGGGSGDITNGGNTTGTNVTIGTNDGNALLFETNNATAMTISQSGNVGIGTSSPTKPLHLVKLFTSTGTNDGMYVDVTGNPSSSGATNYRGLTVSLQGGSSTQTTSSYSGIDVTVTPNQGTASTVYGASLAATANATSPANSLYGLYSYAQNDTAGKNATGGFFRSVGANGGTFNGIFTDVFNNGTVRATDIKGLKVWAGTSSDGASDKIYGGYFSIYNSSGIGIVDNAYGTYVSMSAGPGITNGYGVYLEDIEATNAYGVYQAGSNDKNYFAGNVGVGTTSPSTGLDISGALTARGMSVAAVPSVSSSNQGRIYFDYATNKFKVSENGGAYQDLVSSATGAIVNGGNSTGADISLGTNDNKALAFKVNNSTAMTISQGGAVGIGVTMPTAQLDIYQTGGGTGSATALNLRAGNSLSYFGNNQVTFAYSGSSSYRHAIKSRHDSASQTGNAIDFYLYNYGVDSAGVIGTKQVMTLQGDGNVGIGTTSPASSLQIAKSSSKSELIIGDSIDGSVADDVTRIEMGNSAANSTFKIGQGGSNNLNISWIYNASAGNAYAAIRTNGGSNPLALQELGGNVGVGISSPSAKLHVSGGAIVAAPGSGSSQCTDFTTGNMQVGSYSATNTIKIGGLVDGGAYTLVLTGYTAGQTVTVQAYTDSACSTGVTYGVDFGGSTSAVTSTFTANGNTQLITFIYSSARGVVYASASTNFYR